MIQKRNTGIEKFNRGWTDYKRGFGDVSVLFLDVIHDKVFHLVEKRVLGRASDNLHSGRRFVKKFLA